MIRRLWIKWQVANGKAVDIRSWGCPLSNLSDNSFLIDDVQCASMEGFLQSLKRRDVAVQRQICMMSGLDAKRTSITDWQVDQTVWWKGEAIDRQSINYEALVRRAYREMFTQCSQFQDALLMTRGKKICHSGGCRDSYMTILTPQELCKILYELRDKYS